VVAVPCLPIKYSHHRLHGTTPVRAARELTILPLPVPVTSREGRRGLGWNSVTTAIGTAARPARRLGRRLERRMDSHHITIRYNWIRITVFQMGRARLAARGTTLKSTTLAQPEARSRVLSVGPVRWPFSAWAATPARRAGTGRFFGDPISGSIKIFNHI
jgi:hypothetical protein